ncbi:MAG: hypothetical protein A3J38_04515 [Gammaproteobacteria bacterium RIFCSPHIGHO2_12_FULL_45_9]|nr:MAG: hypothetical protein A3J38_04515 [Gammaproteobacteria bacterium RIFCSPHIGHO2_12_FULL_45_9]
MMSIIGRKKEQAILNQIVNSKEPEFCALVGRRRIGKTFLIRQVFEAKKVVFFNATGMKDGPIQLQITHFTEQIGVTFLNGITPKAGKTWESAFKILTEAIQNVNKKQNIILFLDEFPWMATKNSKLLQTLDYYWNQHWSRDARIKLIVCGSAASWIVDKIICNKGGLHNRVTQTIYLEPFTLYETKQFLSQVGLKLNNKQVTQVYIVTGGVAYYLSQFNPKLSIDQNIDQIAFSKNSFLLTEFENLFASLFESHEIYIKILRAIAFHHEGIGQAALFAKLQMQKGYSLLNKLKSLKDCNFITSFIPLFHKEKGLYYKVSDEYTLFYFHWIESLENILTRKGLGRNYWEKRKLTPQWRSWSGYAFESICHKHTAQISDALGMSATSVPGTWRYVSPKGSTEEGAQIDLLFDRDDDAITLCEIKYTDAPFIIDKAYAAKLLKKMEIFKHRTQTKKQLFLAMISANGLKSTLYSEELVHAVVTLEDLFKSE